MAIKSMTGYGSAVASTGEDTWRIEIRAVNHRHLDVKVRLPRELAAVEPRVREVVAARIGRGHLGIAVTPSEGIDVARDVKLDLPFARRVHTAIAELRAALGLKEEVRLEHLLGFEGVLVTTTRDLDPQAAAGALDAGLRVALDDLDAMRQAEGERLRTDLEARLDTLEAVSARIRAAVPGALDAARERLRERIQAVSQGLDVEWQRDRLEAEVALTADRADVAEELTRLGAHMAAVRDLLLAPDETPCGRKLEFLAIELNRELNTVGSKSSAADVSRLVVDAKAEVERIREQVANIE